MGIEEQRPLTRRELRTQRESAERTPGGADAAGDAPVPAAPAAPTSPLAALFASSAPSPASAPVDGSTPTILVVCSGNICRSPLGELLLRRQLEELGVRVHSAGTGALVGKRMARESQRVAHDLGVSAQDAAAHRARAITDDMVAQADITLTMTVEHRTAVIGRVPTALRRVFTVREFAALTRSLGELPDPDPTAAHRARLAAVVARVAARRGTVPTGDDAEDVIDPFGHSPEVYDESARQLVPAIDDIARVVRAALGQPAGARR